MNDVKELTFAVKNFSTALFPFPPAPGTDDFLFREILVVGMNEVLVRLQRGGPWDGVAVDRLARPIRRIWFVALAWRERREDQTLTAWIDRLKAAFAEAGISL